ncbi:PHO91 [Symbiodinium sp. CCMP2456]|nr:PHO91 [Symbiodinium sp. CCMP2456]
MAAAVASYPGPPRQEALLGTPPSSHRQTQPLPGHGHGQSPGHPLFQRGRRVATPVSALARLWGDEPRREEPQPLSISASAAAPSGGPNLAARARAATQASWNRRSLSPQRPTVPQPQPQPVFIRAQDTAPAPATDTPRTRFQESPSPRSRHRSIRPSMTPSRMGFPDPTSPPADYRAARQTSMSPPRAASRQTVVPPPKEDEDLIHQHVLYILKKNPDVSKSRKVQQVTPGVYLLDGHEVNIEWRHSREPGRRGCPVVVDGPMRQPLIDYLRFSEENKEYDTETVACTTSLHQVPKDKRMTFDDRHKQYSRLEAMKVAKEQACIREQAADCLLDGKQVPDDLVRRYNKALRSKIRSREKDGSGAETPGLRPSLLPRCFSRCVTLGLERSAQATGDPGAISGRDTDASTSNATTGNAGGASRASSTSTESAGEDTGAAQAAGEGAASCSPGAALFPSLATALSGCDAHGCAGHGWKPSGAPSDWPAERHPAVADGRRRPRAFPCSRHVPARDFPEWPAALWPRRHRHSDHRDREHRDRNFGHGGACAGQGPGPGRTQLERLLCDFSAIPGAQRLSHPYPAHCTGGDCSPHHGGLAPVVWPPVGHANIGETATIVTCPLESLEPEIRLHCRS